MANLNIMLADIIKQSTEVGNQIGNLLAKYEHLYHEVNGVFMEERNATGSLDGLEDFYRLTQIVRRNRDIVGSLLRGSRNIRPMEKFSFVEQDVPKPAPKATVKPLKKSQKKKKESTVPQVPQVPQVTEK